MYNILNQKPTLMKKFKKFIKNYEKKMEEEQLLREAGKLVRNTKKALAEKWQDKVITHLKQKTEGKPEITTRAYLKENATELFQDINSVNAELKDPVIPKDFIMDMIDFAVDISSTGSGVGTFSPSPHRRPDLDMYDRFPSQPTPHYWGN